MKSPANEADVEAYWRSLGVSIDAVALYRSCEIFDWHIDTFIWRRTLGYRFDRWHRRALPGSPFLNQVDVPRLRAAGIGSAMWSVTTNPARLPGNRPDTFLRNLHRLVDELGALTDRVAVVRSLREYREAREGGLHAAWVGVQGGNAFEADLDVLRRIPGDVLSRVTLVHLTNSRLGATNSPAARLRRGNRGLTERGRQMVEVLNERRILVDLAHIHPDGLRDALAVHDRTLPAVVTHTGVNGVYRCWRNIDDHEIRAVADTGGVVGIIYQRSFLGSGRVTSKEVVDHLEHVIRMGGEEAASLGSDWDGAIVPPHDMPTCLELPLLAEQMARRKWRPERIARVLGQNALRVLGAIRP